MQCPKNSFSTPPQRYIIVKQLELCSNCRTTHHLRTNRVSNKCCQESNGFHHKKFGQTKKLKKSTFAVNANHDLFHKPMHSTCQGTIWASKFGSELTPQKTRSLNQQSPDFHQKSKGKTEK